MVKKLSIVLLLLLAANITLGQSAFDIRWWDQNTYSNSSANTLKQWAESMEGRVGGSAGKPPALGTGSIFYVDSNVSSEGSATTWDSAKNTLDEAIALCTDNNGDVIYVAQGHTEALDGADGVDIDVAGVTVVGMGAGVDAPEFTYDATSDEFVIGAANVTVMNLRFVCGVSSVTMGISVEAAGDHFTLLDCVFPKPATNSWEFLDAIDVASGVTYITVAGCNYQNDPAGAAPAHFIDLGNAALVGVKIVNNVIYGDFTVSAVWSNDTDTEVYVIGNTISNIEADAHCIEFTTGSATGVCAYNIMYTNAEATTLDPGSLTCFENYTNTAADASGQISVRPDSGINQLNTTTVTTIATAIDALTGYGMVGLCETNSTGTTVIAGTLGGYGDDVFNEGWSLVCIFDTGGAVGTLPSGEVRDITDYATATGTFTTAAWSAALTAGDYVALVKTEALNEYTTVAAGSSAINVPVLYVDDGGSNGEGRTWQTAKTTLAAAEAIAVAGQVIYVGRSHNEAIGSLVIDVAGLKIVGMGVGDTRPILDYDASTDEITINAAGVSFENFRLLPSATETVAGIVLGANGDGCLIENVAFLTGEASGDEFIDGIVYNTATTDTAVKNCTYENANVTAGEADTFVNLDVATIDGASVIGCTVYSDFAEAAIWGGAAVPTNILIKDNVISNLQSGDLCIEFAGAATGHIIGNRLYADTYGANGVTILDPGSAICMGNVATDAINESEIPIPLSATSDDITEEDDGSVLERLEYLQNKSDDILAGIRMSGGAIGNVFYVDDATGSALGGTSWVNAEATMDGAHDEVTADSGDIIFLAPDHTEDIATGSPLTWATAGVTIIGIGEGEEMPRITFSGTASSINVNAASYVFDNINFHSITADSTIGLDIKDAGDNSIIRNCTFTNASGFEFLSAIAYSDDADNVTVENCRFINTGGADATEAIQNTAGTTIGMRLIGNYVSGAYDAAGIFSDDVDTVVEVRDNVVYNSQTGVHAIEFSAAATGVAIGNRMYSDTMASILDPGSLLCFDNLGADAIDEQAIVLPISAETSDVTAVGDGSDLERLEFLQDKSDDILGALGIDQAAANTFFVDSVAANGGTGLTWATSEDTLKAAIDDATNSTGAIIFVAANHAENITASVAIDCPGITIIGLGVGEARPKLTYTATGSVLAHTVANVKYSNIIFISGTADSNVGHSLDGASDGAVFENCEWRSTGAFEFVSSVTFGAAAADNIRFTRCKFNNSTSGVGHATAAVTNIAGVTDGMVIEECEFYGAWTSAAIVSDDADTNVILRDNIVSNTSTGIHAIEFSAAALGTATGNKLYSDTYGVGFDPGSLKCYGNTHAWTTDMSGMDVPLIAGKQYTLNAATASVIATTSTLFTIAGGPIKITDFFGVVTTEIGASNMLIQSVGTIGSNYISVQ